MIHRTELHFDRDFTIMPNAWARDGRLSRKARGLLVELLSHSPGWSVSLATLTANGTEGRDALRSAIRELEVSGYLIRSRRRDASGRLGEAEYALSDPALENPTLGDPTPKKTIHKKTKEEEEIRSFAQRPTSRVRFADDRRASDAARTHLRDLLIHQTGEAPSEDDETWLSSLSPSEAWHETQTILAEVHRWDDYRGPRDGEPAYEALSDVGKRWADTNMLPEGPAVA